jgi:hypothetical protein
MSENVDNGSIVIIVVTFVLFAAALVTKGFTHDLLLESGVFLVSVKLILMTRSNSVSNHAIRDELHVIRALLSKEENKPTA